jgi:tetratricopeptide (TPR) repeat protein
LSNEAIQRTLETALKQHQAGDRKTADALYRQVLEAEPRNPDALHLLGSLCVETGALGDAVRLMEAAVREQPRNPTFLNSLGNAYRLTGRQADALNVLGQALRIMPEFAGAYVNAGTVHHAAGRLNEAEDCYRRAIVLAPKMAQAHSNLGEVLRSTNRLNEALISCQNAVEFDPNFAQAHNHLANVFLGLGRMEEAEASARRAVALDPHMAPAYNSLSSALHGLARYAEAEAELRKALALSPNYALARKNLSGALFNQDKLDEAEAECLRALELEPAMGAAYNNLGLIRQTRGDFAGAEAGYKRVLELQPNDALAQWNYAVLKLLQGDYANGLRLYESRFAAMGANPIGVRDAGTLRALSSIQRWQGEPLAGKTILIWSEQGLGDTVMTLRYLPRVKASGAARIWHYGTPELARLVKTFGEIDAVLGWNELATLRDVDFHCPILSLPFIFGTRLDSIPREVPYLGIPAEARQRWSARLGKEKLNVGLAWAGSRTHRRDHLRSIPLAAFAGLAKNKRVRLVSLQKGPAQAEIAAAGLPIEDWMSECDDMVDTAALMDALDLVITVDTLVVHLAGALGKPVWLLNRLESEWRWMLEREDSPWYPTMRIFRQTRQAEWGDVIARVKTELEKTRKP